MNDTKDSIGDLASTAKGSGARFNGGKAPFELVPLGLLARSMIPAHKDPGECLPPPIEALRHLADWQARRSGGEALHKTMRELGLEGWEECARVFDYGRRKYAEWNWAKGMPWSVPLACAARHLLAMLRGEETDAESGLPHRGHVFCNVVMLLTYEHVYPEGDDRPPAGMLP